MAGPDLKGLVKPALLEWARKQSHMDLATAARSAGQTEDRLREWEVGARVPTLNQLRTLAKVYRRSVGVFFLEEIPTTIRRPPVDFRRFELSVDNLMSPALANGIREAEAKRDAALDIFAQLEELPPVWNLALPPEVPPEGAAAFLLNRLPITMRDRSRWASAYEALNGWRTVVESLGVLVVQLSGVPMSEMRGCSLATFPLPVIILNSSDSPLGRIFTLLHELTHLARNEGGLCDLREDDPRGRDNDAIEAYCNFVAGAMLVPEGELLQRNDVVQATSDTAWTTEQLSEMRRVFWASNEVLLRRLLILGKTPQSYYRTMREYFEREYAARRERQSEDPVIVPYYRRVLLSNGKYLTRLAVDAYRASTITGTELSRILNAKLDHLPKIREALYGEVVA
jgi:Zn-dependent peptidase ImmA (M78 family)